MEKEHIIKISELLDKDIRSRANGNIIRSVIDGMSFSIILDFDGVVFVSRSFMDELYNIVSENADISLRNMKGVVSDMWDAVVYGRNNKRTIVKDNSEIKEFDDMESLASFLATI